MQLIAQDLNQCVFIKLADIDNGRAQRPPSCRLCSEPPIELLFGDKAPLDQDIAKLAAIDSEQVFPGKLCAVLSQPIRLLVLKCLK